MPRLNPVDPAAAHGKAKQLMDQAQATFGRVPNMLRTLANAPAALEAYFGFSKALAGAELDAHTREAIALTTSGINACDYCTSAHTAIGKMTGLTAHETYENMFARSADPRRAAALEFARHLVEKRGWVSDDDLAQVRAAGHDDGAVAEIVATVALTLFTNYFNHVAETEIDFPVVTRAGRKAA